MTTKKRTRQNLSFGAAFASTQAQMQPMTVLSSVGQNFPAAETATNPRMLKYSRHGALFIALICCGCQSMTALNESVPTDRVFCSVARPIYWSKNDTAKTVAQIKEANAAWGAICK